MKTPSHTATLWSATIVACLTMAFAAGASAQAGIGSFTIFDVPGATSTVPAALNRAGTITGYYIDGNGASHGFLRSVSGGFTSFDAPGAMGGTRPAAISPAGMITGSYYEGTAKSRGFLRSPSGAFVTFDAQGALARFGTFPDAISPEGEVTGYTAGADFASHAFLRKTDGAVTIFDAPGASPAGSFPGTFASGITANQAVLGNFTDATGFGHGYLRDRHGNFTVFDAPGSVTSFSAFGPSQVLATNILGKVAGTYFQPIAGNPFGGNYQGFVRERDGTLTTFVAATSTVCCTFTYADSINLSGVVTGFYNDEKTINHGFFRSQDGSVTDFDAPGAGTGFDQGTVPVSINNSGVIAGISTDANGIEHGFILVPEPRHVRLH